MTKNYMQSNGSFKEYDPLPEIVKQFMWATENIRKRKGTPDEKRFYEIAKHMEKEVRKYIYE